MRCTNITENIDYLVLYTFLKMVDLQIAANPSTEVGVQHAALQRATL